MKKFLALLVLALVIAATYVAASSAGTISGRYVWTGGTGCNGCDVFLVREANGTVNTWHTNCCGYWSFLLPQDTSRWYVYGRGPGVPAGCYWYSNVTYFYPNINIDIGTKTLITKACQNRPAIAAIVPTLGAVA